MSILLKYHATNQPIHMFLSPDHPLTSQSLNPWRQECSLSPSASSTASLDVESEWGMLVTFVYDPAVHGRDPSGLLCIPLLCTLLLFASGGFCSCCVTKRECSCVRAVHAHGVVWSQLSFHSAAGHLRLITCE